MKQKDVALIIVICVVSAIFSYILSNVLFGGSDKANLTAPKVEPISADFPTPDDKYFNPNSLNPTKTITIGDSTNTQPF